jgi:hypothetical protein
VLRFIESNFIRTRAAGNGWPLNSSDVEIVTSTRARTKK